jgi:hypothetical protein
MPKKNNFSSGAHNEHSAESKLIGSRRSVSCLRDAARGIRENNSAGEHAASPGSPGDTATTLTLQILYLK